MLVEDRRQTVSLEGDATLPVASTRTAPYRQHRLDHRRRAQDRCRACGYTLGSRRNHLSGEDCAVQALQRVDIGQRIAVEDNEVGVVACPDMSLVVAQAAGLRGERGRGRESVGRGHAARDKGDDGAGQDAMRFTRVDAAIGAGDDRDSG